MIIFTRLPNESSKAYQAFEIYRDMGSGRSIEKVAERLHKNPTALRRLSAKYDWVSRANAHDVYVGQIKIQKMAEEIIEMDRRHALHALAFQETALCLFDRLQKRIGEGSVSMFDEDLDNMNITKAIQLTFKVFRMYNQAAGIERAVRGEKEKRVKHDARAEVVPSPANEKGPIEDETDQGNSVNQEAQPEIKKDFAEEEAGISQNKSESPRTFRKKYVGVANDPEDSRALCDRPVGEPEAGKGSGTDDG
jgi:hypothetical protein